MSKTKISDLNKTELSNLEAMFNQEPIFNTLWLTINILTYPKLYTQLNEYKNNTFRLSLFKRMFHNLIKYYINTAKPLLTIHNTESIGNYFTQEFLSKKENKKYNKLANYLPNNYAMLLHIHTFKGFKYIFKDDGNIELHHKL